MVWLKASTSTVTEFKERCAQWPEFVQYVESTVLGPVKEKFVRVWTDKVIHLGNTTTNMVESSHARLKKYLLSSLGDISKYWERIDRPLL
jgi:hypothetical protein